MRSMHGSAALFYRTPLGAASAGLVRRRLARMWPDCRGLRVAGIGYPAPYLDLWREGARARLACVSAHEFRDQGAVPWPDGACLVADEHLPFPDLSLDRILLVHGLETAGSARRLLREIWRVLRDDGRLLVVAPNRAGLWAHIETTPFGQGAPFSTGQIARLLEDGLFRIEARDGALYAPPIPFAPMLGAMRPLEAIGRALFGGLAGVTLIDAVKDTFAAAPIAAPARRTVVTAEA